MILNGNQRGGAKDLALHLEKDENEHVDVHELRGFMSQNLMGALNEIYAISQGTKCSRFMYSLSLNPPKDATVPVADFMNAIERAEKKLGLTGQPRAIVFHEKEGPGGMRRHCHVVWSRINTQEIKAIPMPYDYDRLRELSRELFLEHGWTMPLGLVNSKERDPRNFTLAEWQQAKRIGKDPRAIKTAIQDAWAISDSKAAFVHALEERGYSLARGDKGRFVAVDIHGEVYSIRQQIKGIRVKQLRQRLGDEKALPSVEQAQYKIANDMLPVLRRFKEELRTEVKSQTEDAKHALAELVAKQRAERQAFVQKLAMRAQQEAVARQARFRKGFKGIWDRLRGEHKRIAQENERDYRRCVERDAKEKDQFIALQLAQRRMIREHAAVMHRLYRDERQEITRDMASFEAMRDADLPALRDEMMKTDRTPQSQHSPERHHTPSREPER